MAKSKSDKDVKDIETKTKPKKTKVKDELLEPKVEPLEPKDETLDNVKVDVEIDLRNDLKQPCVYIRRKRSI